MSLADRRDDLAQGLLGARYEALTPVQKSVVDLIVANAPSGISPVLDADDRTFWDRLADRVADVGGSWSFIATFTGALVAWIGLNILLARYQAAFDPYPFIFLNLVLSTVAALQAPVIMMSQNRQAVRDRLAAEHDYTVNLRAELEIMRLHDRLELTQSQIERIEAGIAALGVSSSNGGPTEAGR